MNAPQRILVIRLGALGDLVLCFQAFHEIRRAHPGAKIALLTMPAFAAFASLMPWFDEIIIDERPPGQELGQWFGLIRKIRKFKPQRVYDLQGKLRQTVLFAALGGPFGPQWSGAAPLCSLPRLWPPQEGMHFTDFIAAQLRLAQVPSQPPPALPWLNAPVEGFGLPERTALLIPGCAPGREYKRWPVTHYVDLARRLYERKIAPVAIGAKADAEAIAAIRAEAPYVIDLGSRTSLPQLATLARRSVAVIGNDTGPTHLAAAVGAPVIALMSDKVDPAWSAPHGPRTKWLQGKPIAALTVDEVFVAINSN